ncbi:MAG TPA: vitamin B12 dependent methionine synthase [Spirochaetes bacterium]|nr:vitamin B12 dependent methionine synthase [Spirochaetota bacterium]
MTDSDTIILSDIPMEIDIAFFREGLRIKPGSRESADVETMAREAVVIGRPKVMYRLSFLESRTDHSVTIDGIEFNSRVLAVNLEKVHRVFPYVATGGVELEEWASGHTDFLRQFWADTIKSFALGSAINAFYRDLERRFSPGKTSSMNPGSLEDWPITEQAQLFTLLGDTSGAIGVSLTESSLMLPLKSISGLQFESDETFISCRLCPREKCPGRRAPFDEHHMETRFKAQGF